MTRTAAQVTLDDVTPDGIDTFVLQEFRLHVADASGEAAGIVAGFADHIGSAVLAADQHRRPA